MATEAAIPVLLGVIVLFFLACFLFWSFLETKALAKKKINVSKLVDDLHREYLLQYTWPSTFYYITKGKYGKMKSATVRGSCTVWHYYPSGVRVGTIGGESWLSNQWTRLEWEAKEKK